MYFLQRKVLVFILAKEYCADLTYKIINYFLEKRMKPIIFLFSLLFSCALLAHNNHGLNAKEK